MDMTAKPCFNTPYGDDRSKTCKRDAKQAPLIQVRGLSAFYQRQAAFEQVSMDIFKGSITALIGPSGCGKTSFLSTLNRMIDIDHGSRVDGSIHLDGADILHGKTDLLHLRRRVGMIFQRPNPFPLSIWKNLELPLKEHGEKDVALRGEKIATALRAVGLWDEVKDRLNGSALTLSGGQQQRLCIARALVLEPEVLLMDEPCSALDPVASARIERLIVSLRDRYTVVVVTHNLAQARRVADYVAFFWMPVRGSSLIEFGRCQDLFENPQQELTAAYLNGLQG